MNKISTVTEFVVSHFEKNAVALFNTSKWTWQDDHDVNDDAFEALWDAFNKKQICAESFLQYVDMTEVEALVEAGLKSNMLCKNLVKYKIGGEKFNYYLEKTLLNDEFGLNKLLDKAMYRYYLNECL